MEEKLHRHIEEQNKDFGEIRKALEYNTKLTENLTQQVSGVGSDVKELKKILFGDNLTGDVGVVKKVYESHELLTQVKGIKGFFGIVITIAATIAAVKGAITFWK